jgi:hypothetical protein
MGWRQKATREKENSQFRSFKRSVKEHEMESLHVFSLFPGVQDLVTTNDQKSATQYLLLMQFYCVLKYTQHSHCNEWKVASLVGPHAIQGCWSSHDSGRSRCRGESRGYRNKTTCVCSSSVSGISFRSFVIASQSTKLPPGWVKFLAAEK